MGGSRLRSHGSGSSLSRHFLVKKEVDVMAFI